MTTVKVGYCGTCGAQEAAFFETDGKGTTTIRVCCPWRCGPGRVTTVPRGEAYQIHVTTVEMQEVATDEHPDQSGV